MATNNVNSSADVFKTRLNGYTTNEIVLILFSYFKQLGTGCGREGCINIFCRSNPGIETLKAHKLTELRSKECACVEPN